MIGVGVIGYGYWGPNLARNFHEASGSQLVAVSDLRPERLTQVRARYPLVTTTTDYRDLIADPAIDAIAVATPLRSHFEVAMEALRADKHVLVEKPFRETSEQGIRLIEEASRRSRVLMVDHTFVYTGGLCAKFENLLAGNGLGQLYYYDSVRVNLGLLQHDVSVIWDLAIHDLAIMDYLLPMQPRFVSATGMSHVPRGSEDIAYLTLFFDGDLIAHVHVNWLAPVKVRRTLIGASCKMIVYDDLEPSEKIKVYDKGISINGQEKYHMLVAYRAGDMWAPQLDLTEALRTEIDHFLYCIEEGEPPITGGEAGLRVVRLLEAATQSVTHYGSPVQVNHCATPSQSERCVKL